MIVVRIKSGIKWIQAVRDLLQMNWLLIPMGISNHQFRGLKGFDGLTVSFEGQLDFL